MNQEEHSDENNENGLTDTQTQKESIVSIKEISSINESIESPPSKKCKFCSFPTAYSILLIIELIVFILTYIIPKGLYDKISYSSEEKLFSIKSFNGTKTFHSATQEFLDELGIKIPLDSFLKGYIMDQISIPNTYHKIEEETTNPLEVLLYPVKGCIDSSYISIFLMVMGGNLNLLIDMNALSSGMAALSRVTRGKEFLLLVLVFIIISIGGTTYGMMEEILAFYPILMPIFLKSGFDGMLATVPPLMGSLIGNMFSTVNTFSVVLASYSVGITFKNGIVFRIILFIIFNGIGILYLYIYYRKIKADETSSIVYNIKYDIEKKFLKNDNNEINQEDFLKKENNVISNKNKDINLKNDNIIENVEIKENKDNNDKYIVDLDEKLLQQKKEKFDFKQKISLILFIIGFIAMISGILIFSWWFEHMTAVFLVLGIILMFLYNKGEKKGIEIFLQGAGDFVGVCLIIGIARGINLTLNEGKISDTILNSLSNLIEGLPNLAFAIISFIIFIFLGIFIQSSSGLAILSMPVFAPLADKVGLSRVTLVNTYMFGQYYAAFFTPTGMILIVLSLVNIEYIYWIKFIWPFLIILFVLLILFVIISAYVD